LTTPNAARLLAQGEEVFNGPQGIRCVAGYTRDSPSAGDGERDRHASRHLLLVCGRCNSSMVTSPSTKKGGDATLGAGSHQAACGAPTACMLAHCLTCLCGLLVALPIAAQDSVPPPSWEAALSIQVGYPDGFVQVGENQHPGNRLSFHDDLGVDLVETLDLTLAYHLTPRDRFRFSLQMFFFDGSTTLGNDVSFNGTLLEGGTRLDTETNFPEFLRTTMMYERTLLPFGDRATFSGRVGLTFVFLNFALHGTIAPNSPGHESKEDFETQELPVPLLGFRLDDPLSDRINLYGSLDGGYLPWVNSLRTEGGTVDLTQSHADLALGLSYAWSPSLSVQGGFQYTYFVQHEKSREDDNLIQLSEPALHLGATYRF
jgi:opacity protein-like surface antigen